MTLEPGALHLMLDGLTAPLTKGEMVPATLIFAHAGRVAVAFLVTAPGGGHGNIDHTAKPPQGPPPWVAVTKPHTSGGVCTTCLRGGVCSDGWGRRRVWKLSGCRGFSGAVNE